MKPIRCESLIIEEIKVRSVLSKTGIPGRKYCINSYVGCAHACRYCYATFMKRFTPLEKKQSSLWQSERNGKFGRSFPPEADPASEEKPHSNFLTGFTAHAEPWGSFVDVKINAPEVLRTQMKRAQRGNIIISSVTDPYQPAERKYNITRKCLEVLTAYNFPVNILTKSPLVLKDIDIISKLKDAEIGMTITTDDERIRRIFEPVAPPITARINALRKLHGSGIKTYVFIGPVLPMNPEALAGKIKPYVSSLIIDRMNYITKVKWLYKKYDLEKWLDEGFIDEIITRLRRSFVGKDVEVC